MSKEANHLGRRRVPRRAFDGPLGVLFRGKYVVGRVHQLGEGGLMLSGCDDLPMEAQIALSFNLPDGLVVLVRAIVKTKVDEDKEAPRFGVEFVNLGFQSKRAIRNFVAAASGETAGVRNA